LSAKQGSLFPCDPLEGNVRDIQQLLREKEAAIAQLRREVEALRSVTPLLSETGVFIPRAFIDQRAGIETDAAIVAALATAGPLLADEKDEFDPGIRARLADAAENDLKLRAASGISRQLRRIAAPLLGQM
jgi:hypothetical protein